MGNHDAGDAALAHRLDDTRLGFRVECARRLVEDDDGGVSRQGARYLEALQLPA